MLCGTGDFHLFAVDFYVCGVEFRILSPPHTKPSFPLLLQVNFIGKPQTSEE